LILKQNPKVCSVQTDTYPTILIFGIHSVIVSTLREVKNTRARKSSPPSPPTNYLNFPFKNEIRKKSRWGWLR